MSKHGLGRGLSSLFSIYEDEPKQNDKKVQENNQALNNNKVQENNQVQSNDNILENAKNLLERINTKESLPKDSTELISNANIEPIENKNFLKSKQLVEEKLQKAGKENILKEKELHSTVPNNQQASTMQLNMIQPNPDQPRKTFDQESMKELANSIKIHGVIQPIIVAPRGDSYIIIAGERRWRASKMAGLKTVPVIIKNYTDQQINEIALIENLQREDLNPIETAFAMKQLIDNFGFSQDELAKRLGKSRPAITNTLRLLNLSNEVKAMVESGKLAPNSARALISIVDKEKQIELAKKACNGKMTTRELERIVQQMLQDDSQKMKNKNTLSSELLDFKEMMQRVLGTKVTFLGNDKKGRIYIDYYSKDDLDRIYSIMKKI